MEIDLGKLFRFYLDHWIAIVCSTLAAALAALLFTLFFITPQYKAGIAVYVNNMKSSQSMDAITGSNLSAAQQLVNTYVSIIQSNTVLNKVIEEGKLDLTPKQLREIMKAEQINNTEMFTVSVLDPDPKTALHIANTIAAVAPDMIADFIEGSSAKIVDYAAIPMTAESNEYIPDSPSKAKNTAIGGLLGLVICGLVLTLHYMFDMRLKTEDDIAQYFAAPVLGSIPDFNQEDAKKDSLLGKISSKFKKGGRR